MQAPDSGTYTLYGVKHTDTGICRARRRMGAVVETPAVYLDMTAVDNIRQQYQILGRPSEDGIAELLHLVGLADTETKKVRNFSLGMRQRFGIAVALAGSPDFLVLDEPTNGLDPQGIIEMRELIIKLNREHGITVLISSHILDELARLATHYGFVDSGSMVQEMSAQALEAHARKRTRIAVSDIRALVSVLDDMNAAYTVVSDTEADVYSEFQITALVQALAEKNCTVNHIKEQDESLESFYMNLIGGASHA